MCCALCAVYLLSKPMLRALLSALLSRLIAFSAPCAQHMVQLTVQRIVFSSLRSAAQHIAKRTICVDSIGRARANGMLRHASLLELQTLRLELVERIFSTVYSDRFLTSEFMHRNLSATTPYDQSRFISDPFLAFLVSAQRNAYVASRHQPTTQVVVMGVA